jgi:hypothetical protein
MARPSESTAAAEAVLFFRICRQPKTMSARSESRPRGELDIAAFFAHPDRGAECAADFARVAAALDGFVDVRLQFFLDLAVQAVSA